VLRELLLTGVNGPAVAKGINDCGEVVGYSTTKVSTAKGGSSPVHAFLYTTSTGIEDIVGDYREVSIDRR
jgi:probable HAF family extracellular repeat protein